MVPILRPIALFLALGVCAARADLDLTPTADSHTLDGMTVSYLTFHDGGTAIKYQPPRGWICEGSHDSAMLSIRDHPQASAFIRSAPQLRVPALDAKAAKLFQDKPALLQLPKGAKDVTITAVTPDPLIIDGHHTLEVDLTYSFFGQSCARGILLMDRKGAEVSFVLDCMAPDFGMLETQFRRSLYSFENL